MSTIFEDGDKVTTDWLNKVSRTVSDGLGDKNTPAEIRVHIDAEKAGASGAVQADLNSHKANTDIHFTNTDLANIYLAKTEKASPSGVAPLDASSKVPAAFLPASGGYSAVYDTQALMVAAGAGHLSGEIFLVTDDPTPTLNGEYTATIDAPTVIGDYYFNSGNVAVHGHAASEVTKSAGGTVQDFIDANPQALIDAFDNKLRGYADTGYHEFNNTVDLDSLVVNQQIAVDSFNPNWPVGATGSGFIQVIMGNHDNGLQALRLRTGTKWGDCYIRILYQGATWSSWRKMNSAEHTSYNNDISGLTATNVNAAIDEVVATAVGGGDLKSDFSVQMVGTPSLGQDIATKSSSEAVVAAHVISVDAHDYSKITNVSKVFTDRLAGFQTNGVLVEYGADLDLVTANSEYYIERDTVLNSPPGMNSFGMLSTRTKSSQIIVQILTDKTTTFTRQNWAGVWSEWNSDGGYTHWVGTQTQYDALGAWDNNTIYNIT